jgi:hypothetical protein
MKNTINKQTIIIAFLLFSQLSYAQNSWKKVKSKDAVSVYQSENSTTKRMDSKVDFTINKSSDDLIECITNFDNYKKWNSNCTQSKLLKKTDNNSWIYYSVFSAPFIQDRELYAKATLINIDNKTYKIHIEACPKIAVTNQKYVRITNFYCDYTITKIAENKTTVTVITSLDMAGSLSVTMVNKFSANSLLTTFTNLHNMCEKQLLASK